MDGKKYLYEVVCGNNPEHVFAMASPVPLDAQGGGCHAESYCGQCDTFVRVTVRRAVRKAPGDVSSPRPAPQVRQR